MMPDRIKPGEMFMPVSDEGAALQFFVEAMKANTAVLERVGKAMDGLQKEQRETLNLVHDTRERVIRMESNSLGADLAELKAEKAELKTRVDQLERSAMIREGAIGVGNWIVRNGVNLLILVGFFVLTVIVLLANNKL